MLVHHIIDLLVVINGGDQHNYNLCINAGIGRELCASQIIEIYKSKK